mgnify:CR=1 FL=1
MRIFASPCSKHCTHTYIHMSCGSCVSCTCMFACVQLLNCLTLWSQRVSCVWLFVIPWAVASQDSLSMGLPRHKNTQVGCHFLLQGILPSQGSNWRLLCLLHWQADSLALCHLGSPLFTLVLIILIRHKFAKPLQTACDVVFLQIWLYFDIIPEPLGQFAVAVWWVCVNC